MFGASGGSSSSDAALVAVGSTTTTASTTAPVVGVVTTATSEPLPRLQPSPVSIPSTAKSPDIRFRPYELSKPSPSPKSVSIQ